MSDHYRIALIAHVACERGNAAWPVYEQLKLAGHAVEVVDPLVDPRALDADGAPDLSYLAKFIEVFRPHCVAVEGQGVEEILAAARRSELAPDPRCPRHLVVFGYIGQDNFGDELIFAQICKQMRSRYPGSYVTAVSFETGSCLARHGVVCLPATEKAQLTASLNGADALVFMAGIMVDSAFEAFRPGLAGLTLNPSIDLDGQAAAALLAYAQGVPALCLGIGAGPLSNPDAQALVRIAALAGMRYLARDEHTCELLRACGVPESQMSRKADLAFSLRTDEVLASGAGAGVAMAGEGPYAVVCLRERDDLPSQDVCSTGFLEGMARGLDMLWERFGIKPVFVDLHPHDACTHERVMSAMRSSDACVHVSDLDIDEVLGVLARADMVVAMRLHASIVANAFGVPSVGFAYEDKVASFYEQMGASDFLLAMDAPADQVERTLERLAADRPAQARKLAAPVAQGRALAQEAFEELWRAIDSRTPQVRAQHVYACSTGLERQRAEALAGELAQARGELEHARGEVWRTRDELEQARAEAGHAREEIEALRASHSWRVGNALMRLPSALKRLLGR